MQVTVTPVYPCADHLCTAFSIPQERSDAYAVFGFLCVVVYNQNPVRQKTIAPRMVKTFGSLREQAIESMPLIEKISSASVRFAANKHPTECNSVEGISPICNRQAKLVWSMTSENNWRTAS